MTTLVARLDNAGDVLLTGPAVRAVAADDDVVFLCSEQGAAAASMLPGVARVVVAHAPWIDAHPRPVDDDDLRALVHSLRRACIDEAAVLVSSHQSPLPLALLLRQAGVSRIAAVSHDYAGSLLDHRIPGDPDMHEVERNLAVVARLGHHLDDDDDAALAIRPAHAPAGAAVAAGAVVVHPGASVPARTWSVEHWCALVDALASRGHRVVVTGSPAERPLTAAVASVASARVIDLGGATDLAELAAVLRAAAVVCTGNTGPMHLAAAVRTPVVALFPPTVPAARWRPWGVPHELFGLQDVPCAGCRARTCPLPRQLCIASVPVEDVIRAVEHHAGHAAPKRRHLYAVTSAP